MKKLFVIVVAALFCLALGCGGSAPAVETPEAPEAPEVETPDVEDPADPMAEEEAPAEDAPADEDAIE